MDYKNIINNFVTLPEDYQLVDQKEEIRNNQPVVIVRFQKNGQFILKGPRIIGVFQGNTLVSFKNYTEAYEGSFIKDDEAKQKANAVFKKVDINYARDLSFIRMETQERTFIDNNQSIVVPVEWLKYSHIDGSYNWVTLGSSGVLIEMEIGSRWDYFLGRRKTEMWDNDDWVLAREGKGPQLNRPDALA